MKQTWNVLVLGGLSLAALALRTNADPNTVHLVVVWTARFTLLLFVPAFVLLGQRPKTNTQKIACRAAALAMGLHLLAIMRLVQLTDEAPLAFASVPKAVASLGGAAAAALVLAGWPYWDRRWYRWAVYWPWSVFLFTYLFLARHGEEATRVLEAPLSFLPIVVLLLVALGWRVHSDFRAAARGRSP
jgi:hypothetical protein